MDISDNVMGHKYGVMLASLLHVECSKDLNDEARSSPIRQLVMDKCQLRKREMVAILEVVYAKCLKIDHIT
jgi:hypothetical protein